MNITFSKTHLKILTAFCSVTLIYMLVSAYKVVSMTSMVGSDQNSKESNSLSDQNIKIIFTTSDTPRSQLNPTEENNDNLYISFHEIESIIKDGELGYMEKSKDEVIYRMFNFADVQNVLDLTRKVIAKADNQNKTIDASSITYLWAALHNVEKQVIETTNTPTIKLDIDEISCVLELIRHYEARFIETLKNN